MKFLTVSQWADKYRMVSKEHSIEPGPWRTSRTPYMKEIMDAINHDDTQNIVVMSGSQVGKTELLLNIIGSHMHQEPSPVMIVEPTLDLAMHFSHGRLSAMVKEVPELSALIGGCHQKHMLTFAGANSAASLSSWPSRIVLLDEIDRYPLGDKEDLISIVIKKSNVFYNRKIVMTSTPAYKGVSKIKAAYENSTMEQWCLPCPSCGEYQPLSWDQMNIKLCSMLCKHCGSSHIENEWRNGNGKWIARKENAKTRGFHISGLASPWVEWEEAFRRFSLAKENGTEELMLWAAMTLGEQWNNHAEFCRKSKMR
ncbi:phage terminase large subunit family protein [Desulfitobacterium chlororespirans]|uniref:Phage terminase large subunit (GpA) n=1 Tax=Desulfitobacterium chlororespirans DSM 11544 TaxID=1121395 RepID=A0A1M7U327_9FIRM|nr:phage terminase large subunit family protein [Desulfitobacterium chlororespirans]SHN77355.1 Phage terminase large subunit (GpA) [Desulfitobacterium chlororespirans DSM 11544]